MTAKVKTMRIVVRLTYDLAALSREYGDDISVTDARDMFKDMTEEGLKYNVMRHLYDPGTMYPSVIDIEVE